MSGTDEVASAGDSDGVGQASITFDLVNSVGNPLNQNTQVCWDLFYRGIAAPIFLHIHRGAAGVDGPIVVELPAPNAADALGCRDVQKDLAQEIMADSSNFYVDLHNSEFPGDAVRGQMASGPAPAGEVHLLPSPLRAYDSRDNNGPKIAVGETRIISLANAKDMQGTSFIAVPPGATGALVNLTVASTVGPGGFLTLYSAAIAEPATSRSTGPGSTRTAPSPRRSQWTMAAK